MLLDATIQRCPAGTPVDELVAALRRDGGVVVTGLLPRLAVDAIDRELAEHVRRRPTGFRHFGEASFYGGNTKRIQALAAKSPTFVDSVLLNEVLLGVADQVLLPNCGDYWMSQAETIFIGPGSAAQPLHRDDVNWSHAASLGIDLQVSALVALGDYDAEVGATRVVPMDHGRLSAAPFDEAAAQPVEMMPGDALVYLGRLVHGGGANTTCDRWRKALYVGYLVGWLTPEEAVPHSITPEVARRLPVRARELLGWATIRGNIAASGVEAETQLWQLDHDDVERAGGLFVERI